MREQLQSAYCMHSRAYRETSQIIELLTLEHGLVSCVRRGSRKKNASADYLFSPLLVSWVGKGDLHTLTHIEEKQTKRITRPSLSIVAMYLNELILKLVPKSSPSKEVFNLYESVLESLDQKDKQENLLRLFEIELLSLIGHGLSLDKEMDHETNINKDNVYRYDVGMGPVRVSKYSNTWNIVSGATLLGLQSPLSMEPSCLTEAKQLMRGIISWHLDKRRLHSREILQFIYP